MRTLEVSEILERQFQITPQGIFSGIETPDLNALQQAGEWLEADGDMIIQDGNEQNYLYLVFMGKVEVFKFNTETQKKQVLATLGAGTCMGEIAFIRGDVASANVKALKKTILWRIDHACIKQYIAEYPGGARFCLNIADVLAQRVQEGNTRMIGVSQSLSAYFGNVARKTDGKSIEAPLAAGTAEMEIPHEIYDSFICETMQYEEGSVLSDEHRTYVDTLVKSNQVDFISWLESGQRRSKLKVILKFIALDDQGNPIISHDEDTTHPTDPLPTPTSNADGTVAPQALAKPSGAARPRPIRNHTIQVPQVQARVKGHTAIIKEKPDRLVQFYHYAIYLLLPFVTTLAVIKFLPLESRTGIALNPTYQAFPLSGFLNKLIFSSGEHAESITLSKTEETEATFVNPKVGYITLTLILNKPLKKDAVLKFKLSDEKTLNSYTDGNVTLPAGKTEYVLYSQIIPAGSMKYHIQSVKWEEEGTADATFNVNGKY